MLTAGIDSGFECCKVVLLRGRSLLSYAVIPYGGRSVAETARIGLEQALQEASIMDGAVEYPVAVGCRKEGVTAADETATDSVCCARGANLLDPSARSVIDLGAEKCLVVACEKGKATKSTRNSRCAAGTGRYLGMVGKLLDVDPKGLDQLFFESDQEAEISSACAVFAESEIISLLHQRTKPAAVVRGVFSGLSRRIHSMLISLNWKPELMLGGGYAQYRGIVKALEEQVQEKVKVPEVTAILAAIGAAVLAAERKDNTIRKQNPPSDSAALGESAGY